MRILVVDAAANSAYATATSLQSQGFDVCIALGRDHAIRQLAESAPDAVLLDLGTPPAGGFEAAGRMRELLAGKPTILVVASWFVGAEDRRRSRAAGVDLHLTKPVDPSVLARLLIQLRPLASGG